jgi:SOS-response transcriptional repressor LexA
VKPRGNATVPIIAEIRQGKPFRPSSQEITIPAAIYDTDEQVFVAGDHSLTDVGALEGDLVIVEPRSSVHTGELVLVREAEAVYVGRFWAKHGRREVMDADHAPLVTGDFTVLGAVTLIGRVGGVQ